MMYNNQNMNRMDGIRNSSGVNFTGTNGPTAPVVGRHNQVVRKTDPSSVARTDRYPIPSFFDYRTKPREYDLF